MHRQRRGLEGAAARSRILASGLSLVALVCATACGSAAPSPSAAAAAGTTPLVPLASTSVQVSSAPALDDDWAGFRGDASRLGIGVQGPSGNPVLNWRV